MADTIEGFELQRELGRGGFGVVHLARQPALNRDVAVKILTADATDPAVRARFERECQAIGALSSHPHVVAVYGNGSTTDQRPFLVMEYLSGGTLAQRGALPWAEACEVGVRIASALVAAHRHGIIHRDVKPMNILFTEFGVAKLADFGIASIVDGFETRSGSVTASLGYAAPEVLDGRPASVRSDVYSLAATIVGAVLGHGPFQREDDSVAGLVARVATAPVPDLRGLGVPSPVCDVLERAMSKVPADRPPDAASFGHELAAASGIDPGAPLTGAVAAVPAVADAGPSDEDPRWATGPSPQAVDPTPVPASAAAAGRFRRSWIVAAAAVVVLAVGALAAVLVAGDDDKDLTIATVDDHRSTTTARSSSSTEATVPVDPSVLSETTIVDPALVPVDPAATAPADTSGGTAGAPATTGRSTGRTATGGGTSGTSGSSGGTGTAGTATGGGSSTGGGSATTAAPSGGGAPATTAVPVVTTAAPPTTAGNQPPLLPVATFDFRVPINTNTTLVPAGDKRLAAGWSDPDNTADWLCLEPLPATKDWWVDGMDCEGSGLWVAATTPGVRILELRAQECSPGCGAPVSTTRRTVRVEFYTP